MPEELITAVREYTGADRFSDYVTSAVAERLRQEFLDELSAELEAQFGPFSQKEIDEAAKAWSNYEPDEDEAVAG